MKNTMKITTFIMSLSMSLGVPFSAHSNENPETDATDNTAEKKSTYIDFEDARVQGQSIVSGAVYLSNRKKSSVESMLKQRKSYRDEILNEFEFGVFSNGQ